MSDVCIAVCDGLKGLPDAITTVWELTQVQTCVIHCADVGTKLHLIRNTFRHATRQDWDAMAKDLRPVSPPQAGGAPTAVNAEQAQAKMDDFAERLGGKYPAAIMLWRSAWGESVPFLDYDVEIRKVICTTNAIEQSGRGCPSSAPRLPFLCKGEVPLECISEPRRHAARNWHMAERIREARQ